MIEQIDERGTRTLTEIWDALEDQHGAGCGIYDNAGYLHDRESHQAVADMHEPAVVVGWVLDPITTAVCCRRGSVLSGDTVRRISAVVDAQQKIKGAALDGPGSDILTHREAAEYLRISAKTLAELNKAGSGPPHREMRPGSTPGERGGKRLYSRRQLLEWVEYGQSEV